MTPTIRNKQELLAACTRWLELHGRIASLTFQATELSAEILQATSVDDGGAVDCYWPLIVGCYRLERRKGRLTLGRCERLD